VTLKEKIALHIAPDKKYVSNSSLSTVKKLLLGQHLFFGNEKFLHFGKEIHRRILEPEEPIEHKFAEEEMESMDQMVANALNYKKLTDDLAITRKEEIVFGRIRGLRFKAVYDMLEEPFGSDLKTTSTRTEREFIKSAIKYDYFRQAWIYMELKKLKQFRFYALQKKPPHEVFVLDVADYPDEMAKAKNETLLLIDVIKNNTTMEENGKYKRQGSKTKILSVPLHPAIYKKLAAVAENKHVQVTELVRRLIDVEIGML